MPLAPAVRAYHKLPDQPRHELKALKSLQVLLKILMGEPCSLGKPWVQDILVLRIARWDEAWVTSIVRALKRNKLKVPKNGSPQEAQAYYRWVVATVSEKILSGAEKTVKQAIRRVAFCSEEGENKRGAVGLTDTGD